MTKEKTHLLQNFCTTNPIKSQCNYLELFKIQLHINTTKIYINSITVTSLHYMPIYTKNYTIY